MTTTEEINQRREEDLQRIRDFRLLDDDFMTKCFEGAPECVELVLRIVLNKPDLKVVDVHTQVFVANLLKRSVRLDVLAVDSEGRMYNIEIQRDEKGAGMKRARFNNSLMDAKWTEKGTKFDDLPENYVIFVTETDVLGKGRALYRFGLCDLDDGEPADAGFHILYVNGERQENTPLGKLMHDFFCTNASDMHYEPLAKRVKFFKESKEGVEIMCKSMEELWNKGVQEGIQKGIREGETQNAIENAKRMLTDGALSLEKIAEYSGLALEKVLALHKEMEPQTVS